MLAGNVSFHDTTFIATASKQQHTIETMLRMAVDIEALAADVGALTVAMGERGTRWQAPPEAEPAEEPPRATPATPRPASTPVVARRAPPPRPPPTRPPPPRPPPAVRRTPPSRPPPAATATEVGRCVVPLEVTYLEAIELEDCVRAFLVNTQASFDPLEHMSELDVALRELTGERRRPVKMAHALLWAALKQTIAAQFWYDDLLQLAT